MIVTLDNSIQAWLASQGKSGNNPFDYSIVDRMDGNGPVIGRWNSLTLGPQPTSAQLTSVSTQAQAIATTALLKQGEVAIQSWLDQTAQSFGYDHIISACSYQTSGVDLWKRQGLAFASWRDAVWQAAETMQTNIKGSTAPPATVAALIASLPKPTIPTV